MKPKVGWMDSIDFEDELGHVPTSEVHMDEAWCRKKHTCIVPPGNPGHHCYPKRVYVFDADAYDAQSASRGPTPLELGAFQQTEQQGVITYATVDLREHSRDCELQKIAAPICTAEAMNPNRQILFRCTCGGKK